MPRGASPGSRASRRRCRRSRRSSPSCRVCRAHRRGCATGAGNRPSGPRGRGVARAGARASRGPAGRAGGPAAPRERKPNANSRAGCRRWWRPRRQSRTQRPTRQGHSPGRSPPGSPYRTRTARGPACAPGTGPRSWRAPRAHMPPRPLRPDNGSAARRERSVPDPKRRWPGSIASRQCRPGPSARSAPQGARTAAPRSCRRP